MPGLQYWFSGTALFLAGSFAFTVAVGLIGIKEMIPDKIFLCFLFAAVNLGLLAWYTAAKQERDSTELRDSIKKIAGSTNINPNQSAQVLAEEILRKIPSAEWHLTDDQKHQLGSALDRIPEASRFVVLIHWLPSSNASRMFGNELAECFIAHNWKASGTDDFRINPSIIGYTS